MKEYIVLHSGREVAGRKNPGKNKTITLSDAEAEHPLRIGHIAPKPAEKSNEKPKASK